MIRPFNPIPRLTHTVGRTLLFTAVLATVFTACKKDDDDIIIVPPTPAQVPARNVLYTSTNNVAGNAVVAYNRDSITGSLSMLGTYSTGGTGFINPTANLLGPNDQDYALTISDDHLRLFAVNGGSNNIAVFDIRTDGTLSAVSGSPFPSGGRQPVSVDAYGSKLYVVNKNQDTLQFPNTDLPNYTVFNIGSGGALSQVMGSTVNTLSNASPTQALVSRTGSLLFGVDFLIPVTHPGSGSLRSFTTSGMGLSSSPGSPQVIGGDPMTSNGLGLWCHPTQDVLYVGLPARSKLAVYTYGSSGELSYVTEADNSGAAICWIRSSTDGSRLYTLNSGNNSVSVYNSSSPLSPMESQYLVLSEPGPMFTNVMGMSQVTSSPFFEELSPDGRFLYIVNQNTDYFTSFSGNNVHILNIASGGSLSESASPVTIPTPNSARPVGLVVL